MGAIVAILGDAGGPELEVRLDSMLARSPYRGKPEKLIEGPLAVGIQSMGWDASLASVGNWIVAFHGYIGNWDDLAYERSWRFREGASNAEKVAVAYDDLGDGLFAKLRGEWAVVIWDRHGRALLAARDVAGCRPLFWATGSHGLALVASEGRQILRGWGASPRLDVIRLIAQVKFDPAIRDRTLFSGVSRIPGGMILTLPDPNLREYWTPPPPLLNPGSRAEAARSLRGLLQGAVRRATHHCPCSLALSGGLDSNSILAVAADQGADLQPLSLVYPGASWDETRYIEAAIAAWRGPRAVLQDASVPPGSSFALKLASATESFGNATLYQLVQLARLAQACGHGVLLTGTGGDEWLTGVRPATISEGQSWSLARRLGRGAWMRLAALAGDPRRQSNDPLGWFTRSWRRAFRMEARGRRVAIAGEGPCRRMLRNALWFHQAGLVLELIEQVGALEGVETRHPLMDLDLITNSFQIAEPHLVVSRHSKELLRDALGDLLHPEILQRTSKTVFDGLIEGDRGWTALAGPSRAWALAAEGVIEPSAVDTACGRVYNQPGSIGGSAGVYRLLMAELIARCQCLTV